MLIPFRVERSLPGRRKNFFLHGIEREILAEGEADLSPDGKRHCPAFRGKVIDFRKENVIPETVPREGIGGTRPVKRNAVLRGSKEALAFRLQR